MGVVTAQPDVTDEVDPAEAPAPRAEVLADLEAEVARARFPLDLPGAGDLRALREQVLTQLGTRLRPRLAQPTAPAVVVLGGSSGAGKSTLLNSVVGAEVSAAGVLRPTTRRPVVAVHPADAPALEGQPLTELADVVVHDGVPEGLAILDAPDLDSVHAPNRTLGARLLEAADLWVFVTTASRYGDAIPWRTLTEAESRGITTAVVLNRVPAGVLAPVRADLLTRMDGLGLGSAPLFLIPDVGPHEGLLAADRVAELGAWLRLVARRQQSVGVVRRTTRRGWASLREELFALATGADDQVEALAALRSGTERAPDAAVTAVLRALREGRAALGAPTTRWLAVASTGGPLAPLATGTGRLRAGWRRRATADRSAAAAGLGEEVTAAVEVILRDGVRSAAEAVAAAWDPADRPAPVHPRPSPVDAAALAAAAVREWREAVTAAVATRAGAALDGPGLAALVAAAATGVSGAGDAVAAVLGPDGGLVDTARGELLARAEEAVRAAAGPYLETLAGVEAAPGTDLRVRTAELRELA
ncbi:ABC transporter, partial [Georgenia ruanii]|nr:ABC transporter [Georgenia ruanii]